MPSVGETNIRHGTSILKLEPETSPVCPKPARSGTLRDSGGKARPGIDLFQFRDDGRDENALAGFRPVAPRETGIEEQARSSGGEHHIDTVGVSGSNPLEPTIFSKMVLFRAVRLWSPAREFNVSSRSVVLYAETIDTVQSDAN